MDEAREERFVADAPLPPQRTSPWAIASLLCAVGIACPLLALIAPLLGLKAIAHIRSTPGIGGARLAAAGIAVGLIGAALWTAAAYVWHVEVRTPILRGPEPELRAGLARDVARFKAGFTERGATLPDEVAEQFLDEMAGRYGRLIEMQQDVWRPDPEPGRMSDVVPYVLRFEAGLVQAEAKLFLFADGVSPKWEYIVILDDQLGDISYPPGEHRLPETSKRPKVQTSKESNCESNDTRKRPNVQTSKRPDRAAATPRGVGLAVFGRLDVWTFGRFEAQRSVPYEWRGRMTTETPVIEIKHLVKRFGEQTVLGGINLDVYPGETMVVMGGSGSGKSTLLRHMIGSLIPDSGTVRLFGEDLSTLDEDGLNTVRKQFGILFQSGALFNSMTVGENVALPLQEHTILDATTIEIMVKIKLELVGLREHAAKYPAQISGGMKKRAGLARALALDPKILFYDEPSAGLDPVTSAEIDRLIVDLSRKVGVTSVVVTHEMDSAFTIADRMAMLDGGRMIMIEKRQTFERLRDHPLGRIDELSETEQLVRQFLRGDADGPLTRRKAASSYTEDLLGELPAFVPPEGPSVETTRVV